MQALFNAAARMSVRAIHAMGGEESMNAIIFSMASRCMARLLMTGSSATHMHTPKAAS